MKQIHPHDNAGRQQQGLALLSVLLILSLLIMLANELVQSFRGQIYRAQSQQQREQTRWFAMSAESLAKQALKESFKVDAETTNLDQYWAQDERKFPVDNGLIGGHVIDGQSCFNINALAKADDESKPLDSDERYREGAIFTALLKYLDVPNSLAQEITASTRNWVSAEPLAKGAGDLEYLGLPMPYRSARTLMRDESEWRAVAGVSQDIARKIMPYLCALPNETLAVNVNTIATDQPALLAALFVDTLPLDQAESILQERDKKGWKTVDDFIAQPLLSNFNTANVSSRLTTVSHYFLVNATAELGDSYLRLRTLLARSTNNELAVVRRKFGGV